MVVKLHVVQRQLVARAVKDEAAPVGPVRRQQDRRAESAGILPPFPPAQRRAENRPAVKGQRDGIHALGRKHLCSPGSCGQLHHAGRASLFHRNSSPPRSNACGKAESKVIYWDI